MKKWMSAGVVWLLAISAAKAQPPEALEGLRHLEAIQAAFRFAIDKAKPSVVSIFVIDADSNTTQPLILQPRLQSQDPNDPEYWRFEPLSFGSGVVVDDEAHILTAYHVVRSSYENPRQQILVRLHDGSKFQAQIYAADPRSDLAVLQLERGDKPAPVTPIEIGKGEELYPGQFVLAIGNPYSVAAVDGETSASWGIISNIRRRAIPSVSEDSLETTQSLQLQRTLVQTDARLNTGISGGALINIKGQLVGVTMALSASVGFETPGGFALPTDDLTRRTIDALRQGKEMEYGFVGIVPTTIDAQEAEATGALPVSGAKVSTIFSYLPAYQAGLREGDIITHIEGKRIHNINELVLAVGSRPVDTKLPVQVVRKKEKLDLVLPLAKYPVMGEIIATNKRPVWNGIRVDHLSVILGPRTSQSYFEEDLRNGGVVIRYVDPNSRAYDEHGLREGQIITEVNGSPVRHPDEFEKQVTEAKGPVSLTIFNPTAFNESQRRVVQIQAE